MATRRLRAALPLAWADSPNTSWVSGFESIRQWGKHLGRVREVDVALEQLPSIEARVPPAAPAIAEVRLRLAQKQSKQRRQLVKNLEHLSLDRLRATWLVPTRGISLLSDRRWHSVERAIVEHAESLLEAVHDASGVYFPKRAHRVRVETKKLRYVLELVGSAESAAMVKRLRRAQEVLGQLHDHQVLAHSLSSTKRLNETDRRALLTSVDAKCEELFQLYLTRRSQLVEVSVHARAAATRGAWRPRSFGGMLLTASAMAVPSAVFWIARSPLRGVASGSPGAFVGPSRRDVIAESIHAAATPSPGDGGEAVKLLTPAAASRRP